MFLVDRESKKTSEIKDITFTELGLKERQDLQEWISNNPGMLGEDLLIIQKEFNDFNNTNERLDLLALDKLGNLVIIENKLDDSGKDVVWQAMKYAGYCSTLTNEQIKEIFQRYLDSIGSNKNAEESILEFYNKESFDEIELNQDLSQRIILVARFFRAEVTNTVMWASKYGINIKCIEIIPYLIGDKIIVDANQIIPEKSTEDMIIRYQEKALEQLKGKSNRVKSELYRDEFWHSFLHEFNKKSNLFLGKNIDLELKNHWFSTGAGLSGVNYVLVVTKDYAGVALEMAHADSKYNKDVFDFLYRYKDQINMSFGDELSWERDSDKKSSRIIIRLYNVSLFEKSDWNVMMDFMSTNIIKLESIFKKYIVEYKKTNKNI